MSVVVQDEPPWKEYDTVSFDEGNQMTPYTLRKVLEVSRHSIRVAMRILAKNSFDAEATELLSRPPRLISPLHEDEADNR
ncbi:hypothetical protein RRF57_011494 [Xylaria bambusicola]|uniref:Uncharacterized protein n=1 Tax=Xylaria bambusicola TaxID=326684 RepID=A0AAN7ZA38_9PEZI